MAAGLLGHGGHGGARRRRGEALGSCGISWKRGGDGSRGGGEVKGASRPSPRRADEGRPAARQLPGSHAVAAGELAACLSSGGRRPCPFGLGLLCWARWAR